MRTGEIHGFGKSFEENWQIMRRLPELLEIGYPILIGASRKSMLAKFNKTCTDALEYFDSYIITTSVVVNAFVFA